MRAAVLDAGVVAVAADGARDAPRGPSRPRGSGVPVGAAMSMPACRRPQRVPNGEVKVPLTGQIRRPLPRRIGPARRPAAAGERAADPAPAARSIAARSSSGVRPSLAHARRGPCGGRCARCAARPARRRGGRGWRRCRRGGAGSSRRPPACGPRARPAGPPTFCGAGLEHLHLASRSRGPGRRCAPGTRCARAGRRSRRPRAPRSARRAGRPCRARPGGRPGRRGPALSSARARSRRSRATSSSSRTSSSSSRAPSSSSWTRRQAALGAADLTLQAADAVVVALDVLASGRPPCASCPSRPAARFSSMRLDSGRRLPGQGQQHVGRDGQEMGSQKSFFI